MPIIRSAKKALRQNQARRIRNTQRKKALKQTIKELKKLVAAHDLAAAQNYLPKVYKALDKNAKVNVMRKNTASRLKSRLSILVSSLSSKS